MSDEGRQPPSLPSHIPPGTPTRGPRLGGVEIVAGLLTLGWLGGIALFLLFGPEDPANRPGLFVTVMAVVLPVASFWAVAAAARSARVLRDEAQRLHAAIDALRQTHIAQVQAGGMARPTGVEKKLDEIAQAQRKTELALATFASIRASSAESRRPLPPPASPGTADQPTLALEQLDTPAAQPLTTEDFIRALNFPENPDDTEGFRALRRALEDRGTSHLIQASQDVLTLLSQDGIYMDDLRPDRAKPDIWRRFATGERGRPISALGGIRDRSSLALASGRMRSDMVFRDAVHHFLRRFDQALVGFEKRASDGELAALADTRTARAFMLLGRVAGIFD